MSVLIVDGHSDFALATLRCLGAMPDVAIHVLSRRKHVPAAASRYVSSAHVCDTADDLEYLQNVLSAARLTGADLCMAVDEPAIRLVARHSGFLSFHTPLAPVPSIDSLDIASDKWKLAAFMHAHGLPHPPTSLGPSIIDNQCAARGPVLLKPRRGGNGIGIRHFAQAQEAAAFLAAKPSLADDYIVQDFVHGSDIDCSVVCSHGEVVAHTIQRSFTAPPAHFKPAGGVDFVDDAVVLSVVRSLMAALGWHGVAHLDLRYDAKQEQLYVIEMNPRFWGSLLGSLHAGVNFPYLSCRIGLELPVDRPTPKPCRFVSGSTAMQAWRRGRFGRRAGFRVTETALVDMWRDPKPSLVELCNSVAPPVPVARGSVARLVQLAASAAAILLSQS